MSGNRLTQNAFFLCCELFCQLARSKTDKSLVGVNARSVHEYILHVPKSDCIRFKGHDDNKRAY